MDEPLNRWVFGALSVTEHEQLPSAELEDFYRLYASAFEPLRTRAAARQVLHRGEFDAEMDDPLVTKYVAWDGGQAVGMTTLTRHLESVPWISPEFYAARYPDYAARKAIFYLGFVLVRPDLKSSRVFHRLMQVLTDYVESQQGVVAYDICAFNNSTLSFSDRIESFVHRRMKGSFDHLDSQDYYGLRFGDGG